jgi:glycerophosphoryl diester phosphodiesterase
MIAPQLAGSVTLLLLFVAGLAIVGTVLALAVGIFNFSLFAILIMRMYLGVDKAQPDSSILTRYLGEIRRFSGREMKVAVAVGLLLAVGAALVGLLVNRNQRPVMIIAHRGSSWVAPENTLAAFRLAADERADFVELDVQETSDGQVIVAHDSDLMKVANNPTKIWEGSAETLRAVDIGSYKDPRFSSERVPTLAEALDVCKGRCKVVVELKSYGHNDQLEQRVVDIVEAAGMQDDCVFMSLDHGMARKMKELRPSWRVGVLVAKSIGDLTQLNADFLAVEARMATRRFVRQAHNAGQDVYIWTVNDPAWMLVALSRGVDGLITDKPDQARNVVEVRARMSSVQRFLASQLIRFGASTEALEAETALRPENRAAFTGAPGAHGRDCRALVFYAALAAFVRVLRGSAIRRRTVLTTTIPLGVTAKRLRSSPRLTPISAPSEMRTPSDTIALRSRAPLPTRAPGRTIEFSTVAPESMQLP